MLSAIGADCFRIITVGSARTVYSANISWFSSNFILKKSALSFSFSAADSNIGASCLHGGQVSL